MDNDLIFDKSISEGCKQTARNILRKAPYRIITSNGQGTNTPEVLIKKRPGQRGAYNLEPQTTNTETKAKLEDKVEGLIPHAAQQFKKFEEEDGEYFTYLGDLTGKGNSRPFYFFIEQE